jgi:hypothetical protein
MKTVAQAAELNCTPIITLRPVVFNLCPREQTINEDKESAVLIL